MNGRPQRVRAPDFAGRPVTLPDEPESWHQLAQGGSNILLLGSGPACPWELPFIKEALTNGSAVFCLDAPYPVAAPAKEGQPRLPKGYEGSWQYVDAETALQLLPGCSAYFYRPGMRLAPDFWGPLLARIALRSSGLPPKKSNAIWLPGDESLLLHQELRSALKNLGHENICEAGAGSGPELLSIWNGEIPGFAISVNFRGLDSGGSVFEMCRAAGTRLAIWLVDNPWTLLSGIALPWWKQADLFVTDASFISELKRAGARNVWFLPLAAAQHMKIQDTVLNQEIAPVFVGSSAFANQKSYFSGIKLPEKLRAEAGRLLKEGGCPDFHWWQERRSCQLWPGHGVRQVALGADEFSVLRRAQWIAAAQPCGLKTYGDEGWKKLLPGAAIEPPVDYYRALPEIYGSSECVLNVTSGLLPQSLNQRHFDVWAAGGFLLSDFTKGLELFPSDLAAAVSLSSPQEFGEKLQMLRDRPRLKAELAAEWRETISREHGYADRIATMFELAS